MRDEWGYHWLKQKKCNLGRVSWSKRRILKVLDRYVMKGMSVLDAGCGTGFFSRYFISKGCLTYPLDYSEEALSITRGLTDNKAEKYLRADLLGESFEKEYGQKFDLIFSDGLLEHYSKADQAGIIKTFEKIRKKDGVIATVVPNRFSFWMLVKPFYMHGIKETPFILPELRDLHRECGLEIIESGGLSVLPVFFSPEMLLGGHMGMQLFCVAR